MRRIAVPALLLVVLLVAYATRWQVVASRTQDFAAVKWVRDRWTGETWIRMYLPNKVEERPGSVPDDNASNPFLALSQDGARKRAVDKRDRFTNTYYVTLALVATWLFVAAIYKPTAQHNSEEPSETTPPT